MVHYNSPQRQNNYKILSIDTSCDETAAAVTVGRRVLSNIIWSQVDVHRPWGGVVPDLARKEHQKHLGEVVQSALTRADANSKRFQLPWRINWDTIDAIAVTQGPGLAIALEVGIKKAKELAKKHQVPLIAVNHMEGHLLSPLARNAKAHIPQREPSTKKMPTLGLLISGGHTQLVLVKKIGDYQLLGETLDDAAGEAFDKVAKMLDLGYPGGPIIEKLACQGSPHRFQLPVPMARDPSLNFSFSGLKTACLYKLRAIPKKEKDRQFLADFAASFQATLTKAITIKLKKVLEMHHPKQIFLGGGVINNLYLRKQIRSVARKHNIHVFTPYSRNLISDNAAMIGIAAFFKAQRGEFVKNINLLDRQPNLNFPFQASLN